MYLKFWGLGDWEHAEDAFLYELPAFAFGASLKVVSFIWWVGLVGGEIYISSFSSMPILTSCLLDGGCRTRPTWVLGEWVSEERRTRIGEGKEPICSAVALLQWQWKEYILSFLGSFCGSLVTRFFLGLFGGVLGDSSKRRTRIWGIFSAVALLPPTLQSLPRLLPLWP